MNINIYIKELSKSIYPNLQISKEVVEELNKWNEKIAKHLVDIADKITTLERKHTIGPREVQGATRIFLPVSLENQAVMKATRAVTFSVQVAGITERTSATEKAGLIFSVPRFNRLLRSSTNLRVSKFSPVYLTAVMEYLTSEVITGMGNKTISDNRVKMTIDDLQYAIKRREVLKKVTNCS
jgi:histone H3/H4